MKKTISILLLVAAMVMALGISVFADDTGLGVEPGDMMPDFTVSLTDGTTASLSDLLAENDVVVVNIFASWCGPCEREFPEMEAVYEDYSDRIEIVAVSGDANDTMDVISEYKTSHGLTFPMGLLGDQLSTIDYPGFPTTLIVDRNGMIGYIQIGAFTGRAEFEDVITYLLSPDYDGTPIEYSKPFNWSALLIGWHVIGCLCVLIGRWGLFRKAGKKGWFSLIPFLSGYTEYSTCWNGWLGLIPGLTNLFYIIWVGPSGLSYYVGVGVVILGYLVGVPEGLKLAKAYGKGRVFGILLALPVLREVCKLILGLSKAQYSKP